MATSAYSKLHPFGTTLLYTTGTVTSPSSYATLGDVKSITVGGVEFGESEITHLSSTNAFRQSMAGWGKAKPLGFSLFFEEANFLEMLETLSFARSTYSWIVQFNALTSVTTPSGSAYYYATAWIKDLSFDDISTDGDDPIMYKVELGVTGRPDFSTT